jgi:hypothetical protein
LQCSQPTPERSRWNRPSRDFWTLATFESHENNRRKQTMDGNDRPGHPGGRPHRRPVDRAAQYGLLQRTRKDRPGTMRYNGADIHRQLGRNNRAARQQPKTALWPDPVHGPTPGRQTRGVFFNGTDKDQQAMNQQEITLRRNLAKLPTNELQCKARQLATEIRSGNFDGRTIAVQVIAMEIANNRQRTFTNRRQARSLRKQVRKANKP